MEFWDGLSEQVEDDNLHDGHQIVCTSDEGNGLWNPDSQSQSRGLDLSRSLFNNMGTVDGYAPVPATGVLSGVAVDKGLSLATPLTRCHNEVADDAGTGLYLQPSPCTTNNVSYSPFSNLRSPSDINDSAIDANTKLLVSQCRFPVTISRSATVVDSGVALHSSSPCSSTLESASAKSVRGPLASRCDRVKRRKSRRLQGKILARRVISNCVSRIFSKEQGPPQACKTKVYPFDFGTLTYLQRFPLRRGSHAPAGHGFDNLQRLSTLGKESS